MMQIQRLGANSQPTAKMVRAAADGARAARLQIGDRTHLVVSRSDAADGPVRCAGLETDGQAAAIELAGDGTMLRAVAVNATFLRYDGRLLFDADAPANWATGATGE